MINRTALAVGVIATLAAIGLTVFVAAHPFIPADATVERDVQSTPWGPLVETFPFFSWIGDVKGFFVEAALFVVILVVNRRAWIVAALAAFSAGWYILLNHLVLRARPSTSQVLRVTEHPGASSFPSGHTIFLVTVVAVIMLGLGYRFLHGWGRAVGWSIAALIVFAGVIDRIYTGAHWPSDVLAGILIAVAWLALILSWRPLSSRVLAREDAPGRSARRDYRRTFD